MQKERVSSDLVLRVSLISCSNKSKSFNHDLEPFNSSRKARISSSDWCIDADEVQHRSTASAHRQSITRSFLGLFLHSKFDFSKKVTSGRENREKALDGVESNDADHGGSGQGVEEYIEDKKEKASGIYKDTFFRRVV